MNTVSPADLRAEIARRQLRLYELAPHVGVHPTRLGQALNEKVPMTAELAERIQRALQGDAPERGGA